MFKQNVETTGCHTVREVMEKIHEKDGGLENYLMEGEKTEIRGLKDSVALITDAMNQKEPVKIIGDYDTDGIMSSIILYLSMLIRFKTKAQVRLPRRFTEGYGLSMKIIDEADKGILICVDNGITAVEQIAKAKKKGLKVIVMDHHLIRDDKKLPECDVLIDPHIDESAEFDDFCGAGLAYRFAEELLGENNPYLPDLLVMASIATVADMVTLKKDNRQLLKKGLEAVNSGRGTKGLRHLIGILGMEYVDEETYGFLLGPICNASGRLKDDGAKEVFDYLYIMSRTHEESDLLQRANALISTNNERKDLVRESMANIASLLEETDTTVPIVLLTDIHEGIVGIVAGNLAERYGIPVLVFTRTGESGILKGSGRSGGSCHLKKLLDKSSDLFIKYGGHAGAGGMTLKEEYLERLRESLKKNYMELGIPANSGQKTYDLEISSALIHESITELKKYSPFGNGNRKPVFYIREFECTPKNGSYYMVMGKNGEHVKLFGTDVSAIGFQMAERYKADGCPQKINILCTLSENYFNGKIYDQIEIIDYDIPEVKVSEIQRSLMELLMF